MQLSQSFLQSVLKPGRYLGGETGLQTVDPSATASVVWFYPDRYEHAMTDPGWRRGFFALAALQTPQTLRAIDFMRDVWARLSERQIDAFTIDGHHSIRDAAQLVFWAPDVFTAARIPSILRRLNIPDGTPRIGVVVAGIGAPTFLKGHVDWVIAAPNGWLPDSIPALLEDSPATSEVDCYQLTWGNWDSYWSGPLTTGLLPTKTDLTPQWNPRVETGSSMVDVELYGVGANGRLCVRPASAIVADTLNALNLTGAEGIRFCDSGLGCPDTLPVALIELTRNHNMKRTQAELPVLGVADLAMYWRAYKPHLIKPSLRLRVDAATDTAELIEAGRKAFNDGWYSLTTVLTFDSWDSFSAAIPRAKEILKGWAQAAGGFADKRPLRAEFAPAPIDQWIDPPSGPPEDDFRRLAHEGRRFLEETSNTAASSSFRIEDLIVRNWLAAADADIWDALSQLDLTDSGETSAQPFDWVGWLRNHSGLTAPPTTPFSRKAVEPSAIPEVLPGVPLRPESSIPAANGGQVYGRRKKRAVYSRRLSSPERTRMRVCWGKRAEWRLYSHLDSVRAIERTIRRSRIPAAYSEGFRPHLKLSFGPPLAFGLTSGAELFDLILERSVEESDIVAFRKALPDGLFVVRAEGMPAQMPSLAEVINEAVYEAILPLDQETAQAAISKLMNQPKIEWVRTDRPGKRPTDPRNSLRTMELESTPDGLLWRLALDIRREGGIRPGDWARLVFDLDAEQLADLVIKRTALQICRNDRTRSVFVFP